MTSIVSTSRPYGLDNNSSSINTGSNISNNTPTGSVATNGLTNTLSSKKEKPSYKTPGINNFESTTRQQAIVSGTENNSQPTIKYENRYLNNVTSQKVVNNSNLSNTDRSNLNILNNWTNKLKATNRSNNVTTYMDDPSTVPLLRRDTLGFFNVDYNSDGTYHVTTTGIKIPFTDITVGNWDLGNMSWNPIKAYNVGMPLGSYLMNYNSYNTKNKIVQGTLAIANSYNNYYDGKDNFVDDYAIKEWGNLVDMSINWKDRNAMQNTVAGLNTVTGLSQRYGFNDYLGGDKVVGGIQNVLALYTFGNSVYQLGNNWSSMSAGERAGASLSTINAGIHAYRGAKDLYNLYNTISSTASTTGTAAAGAGAGAGAGAAVGGASAGAGAAAGAAAGAGYAGGGSLAGQGAYHGAIAGGASAGAGYAGGGSLAGQGAYQGATTTSVGTSSTLSTVGTCLGYIAAIYGGYQYNKFISKTSGVHQDKVMLFGAAAAGLGSGRNTADDRKNATVMGASAGAAIGTCICPGLGTAIGAAVGSVCGLVQTSGKFGHSREQYHRGIYREALGQTGIFEKAAKGTPHAGHFYYQLADGQYYNVGIDGHSGRASDINGKIKTVYDQSQILDRDWHNSEKVNHEIRPYDVDYTCNMDYTGSLMLAPLNALGLGGSNIEDAAEYNQMLGYMTNACTSNVGRDMTRENFNKMISNIQAGYERVGINNRQDAQNALALSYMQGNITDEDWDSFQLALNLLYSDNGYDQAMSLMDQLGRDTSQKSVEEIGSAQPSGEEIDPGFNGNNRPAPTDEAVRPGEELTPVSGKADVSEMYVQQDLNPADIPADTSTARPERATQEDLMNETNPAKDAAREQFIQEHGTGE